MKHLFKELSFIAPVVRMLTISKLTAHVLKHVAKPLQKTWRITWMKLQLSYYNCFLNLRLWGNLSVLPIILTYWNIGTGS